MTDDKLKARIVEFTRDWVETGGDRYWSPGTADWDTYGRLEAHLLRFCRALLSGEQDLQWEYSKGEGSTIDLFYKHWPRKLPQDQRAFSDTDKSR